MTKIIAMGRTIDGRLFPISVDSEGRLVVSPNSTGQFSTLSVGEVGSDYTLFDTDGTMQAFGDATCWRDELQSITGAQIDSPAGDFTRNAAEGSVTAKITARYPTDFVYGSWQLNHDWALGTAVYPHIHWWQTTANTPNWLFANRWQKQGGLKTTDWTGVKWAANAFTWASDTLNQITMFGSITAPAGYGEVSDIIQIRLYRDYTNVSGYFAGNDPVNASQDFVNVDGHINIDMLGSRGQYYK